MSPHDRTPVWWPPCSRCPRANSGQHGSSPGAAVRRTLEQASVGASSCMLLDTARSPWAPAQAPQ
eukprot:scaffold88223_cov36-Phaeocystis_antarctica.AAC.1